MLEAPINIGSVAHAIQLALTPAFLLTAIAGILNVMTGRLARIVDRGRALTENSKIPASMGEKDIRHELGNLEKRRFVSSAAINMCTLSALLVCIVTAGLFIEVLLEIQLRWMLGLLFTASNISLVIGLGFFLREVQLATKTVRIPAYRDPGDERG